MTFDGGDEFLDTTYNPSGYIASLISAGEGPTAGLRIFRDDGGHIQDSRWFQLYGQVAQSIANEPNVLGLDPYSVPGPSDYNSFASGQGGRYVTTLDIQMIDRGTGLWFTQKAQYWTNDPHSPAEAMAWAMANYADVDSQDTYEVTVMGALAVNVSVTTPFEA